LGWICIALGALAPFRLVTALYNVDLALYCRNIGVLSVYEPVLGLLVAGSGWGLIRRRRWAPAALSISAGALLALAAGSLFVVALKFLEGRSDSRDPQFVQKFLLDRGPFALGNTALIVASLMVMRTLFRTDNQREFSTRRARPVILATVTLLSFGYWLALNWYCWVHYVR
jgi:hypothetical protein